MKKLVIFLVSLSLIGCIQQNKNKDIERKYRKIMQYFIVNFKEPSVFVILGGYDDPIEALLNGKKLETYEEDEINDSIKKWTFIVRDEIFKKKIIVQSDGIVLVTIESFDMDGAICELTLAPKILPKGEIICTGDFCGGHIYSMVPPFKIIKYSGKCRGVRGGQTI